MLGIEVDIELISAAVDDVAAFIVLVFRGETRGFFVVARVYAVAAADDDDFELFSMNSRRPTFEP